MTALIKIDGLAIAQDAEGRYCLNDLHRASGGESKHQPAFWLRNAQVRALIEEIRNSANSQSSPVASTEGSGGGTFVAKELVYAYAMWISAAFHLKVIRAYDTMVAPAAFAIPQTMAEALRLAAATMEERDQLALENKAQASALEVALPKADALDLIAAGEKSMTIRETAKLLSVKERELTTWLHEHGWVYRQNGRWIAKQLHIAAGRLVYKEARYTDQNTGHEVYAPYCHITPKGLAKLASIFGSPQPLAA